MAEETATQTATPAAAPPPAPVAAPEAPTAPAADAAAPPAGPAPEPTRAERMEALKVRAQARLDAARARTAPAAAVAPVAAPADGQAPPAEAAPAETPETPAERRAEAIRRHERDRASKALERRARATAAKADAFEAATRAYQAGQMPPEGVLEAAGIDPHDFMRKLIDRAHRGDAMPDPAAKAAAEAKAREEKLEGYVQTIEQHQANVGISNWISREVLPVVNNPERFPALYASDEAAGDPLRVGVLVGQVIYKHYQDTGELLSTQEVAADLEAKARPIHEARLQRYSSSPLYRSKFGPPPAATPPALALAPAPAAPPAAAPAPRAPMTALTNGRHASPSLAPPARTQEGTPWARMTREERIKTAAERATARRAAR
jgi:hypothetical protein